MNYPHEWEPVGDGIHQRCRCGETEIIAWESGHPCRAALLERVAELEQHIGSLHKATAAGRDAERAAVVAWLRSGNPAWLAAGALTDDPWREAAAYIEAGEHRSDDAG